MAIRHAGSTYSLNYDPDDYGPGTNIIGVSRDAQTIDL